MSVFTEPEYRFTAQLFGGKRLVTCQSSNSMLVTDHDGTIIRLSPIAQSRASSGIDAGLPRT